MVRERLQQDFVGIETETIGLDFDLEMSPAEVVRFFRSYFGPTQTAFHRLDQAGKAALQHDLVALWTEAKVATNPEQHTMIRNEYLQVMAVRR